MKKRKVKLVVATEEAFAHLGRVSQDRIKGISAGESYCFWVHIFAYSDKLFSLIQFFLVLVKLGNYASSFPLLLGFPCSAPSLVILLVSFTMKWARISWMQASMNFLSNGSATKRHNFIPPPTSASSHQKFNFRCL